MSCPPPLTSPSHHKKDRRRPLMRFPRSPSLSLGSPRGRCLRNHMTRFVNKRFSHMSASATPLPRTGMDGSASGAMYGKASGIVYGRSSDFSVFWADSSRPRAHAWFRRSLPRSIYLPSDPAPPLFPPFCIIIMPLQETNPRHDVAE